MTVYTKFEEGCAVDPVTGVTVWRQHLFTARGWVYAVGGEPEPVAEDWTPPHGIERP